MGRNSTCDPKKCKCSVCGWKGQRATRWVGVKPCPKCGKSTIVEAERVPYKKGT